MSAFTLFKVNVDVVVYCISSSHRNLSFTALIYQHSTSINDNLPFTFTVHVKLMFVQ